MTEFHSSDLTFIIPTIGNDLKVLSEVIRAIKADAADVRVLVVWDGHQPLNFIARSQMLNDGATQIIEHPENRGAAAARNTGVDHSRTQLSMFVDDDIVPTSGFISKLLSFHNANPEPLRAVMGKVTWEGSSFSNSITRWNETKGNWNVFSTTVHGAKFSDFMSGFTCFKTETFRRIRFDESFKKYGCEDTELGLRFFGFGGELVFMADIVGYHHKAVSAATYCREHIAAGYSKALLATLHPDDCFSADYFRAALRRTFNPQFFQGLCAAIDALCQEAFCKENHSAENSELADLLAMLTSCAMLNGFACYFHEHYPQITALDYRPEAAMPDLAILASFPPLALDYASQQRQNIDSLNWLIGLQKQMPHYFAPYLRAWQISQDHQIIELYLQKFGDRGLSSSVRRAIALTSQAADSPETHRLTTRELYKKLLALPDNSCVDIHRLAASIVQQDPTYVGAYIKLAQSLQSQNELAQLLCHVARYFAALRPRLEQNQHLENIAAIEHQLYRS